MPFLTPQRGKRLFSITVTLLIAAGAASGHPADRPLPAQIYFFSTCPASHISLIYTLYEGDTTLFKSREKPGAALRKNDNGKTSGIIRREKNGDLVIVIPEAAREKYKIRFFDDDNNFLFEVRQIRDPLLILEKYNFQHTGLFQYELYRENQLVERSTFLIRKD